MYFEHYNFDSDFSNSRLLIPSLGSLPLATLSHFSYSYLSQAGSTRFPLRISFPNAANISSPGREGARGGERVIFLQNTKEFNI